MSDDMVCQVAGWDEVIRSAMEKYFPDLDGMLWFNDGYQDRISTLTIWGRKYYDRFGYIYHSDYSSLFCDEEQTQVAKRLGKLKYFDSVLFKHEHCINNQAVRRDKLYDRNERYYRMDEKVYKQRESNNFYL